MKELDAVARERAWEAKTTSKQARAPAAEPAADIDKAIAEARSSSSMASVAAGATAIGAATAVGAAAALPLILASSMARELAHSSVRHQNQRQITKQTYMKTMKRT